MSEKAKVGTEFIQRLKGMSEKVHVSLFPWKPDYYLHVVLLPCLDEFVVKKYM